MTQRDRQILVYIFGGLAAVFLVGFIAFKFVWSPYRENLKTMARLERERDEKLVEVVTLTKGKKLLERARMQSLPGNLSKARFEYLAFLHNELDECDLPRNEIREVTPEAKTLGAAGAKKDAPAHTVLAFHVRTAGTLPDFVAFLERMKTTPLLHRIKSFTINRPEQVGSQKGPSGKLDIAMVIEALVVNRSDNPSERILGPDYRLAALDALAGLQRGPIGLGMLTWAMGPAGPGARIALKSQLSERTYADLSYRNIFTGPVPPVVKKEEVSREADDAIDIRDWVRLASITHREMDNGRIKYYAQLRNYFTDPNDAFVTYVKLSLDLGYRTFAIKNESLTKTVLRGHVLKIDQHHVYFQVGEDAYRLGLGEKVSDALSHPLREEEMTEAQVRLLEPDPEDVLIPTKNKGKGKKQKR